jgi:hypothetical protein
LGVLEQHHFRFHVFPWSLDVWASFLTNVKSASCDISGCSDANEASIIIRRDEGLSANRSARPLPSVPPLRAFANAPLCQHLLACAVPQGSPSRRRTFLSPLGSRPAQEPPKGFASFLPRRRTQGGVHDL